MRHRARSVLIPIIAALLALSGVQSASATAADPEISFCHATSSATNPYNALTTSVDAFIKAGHVSHADDIYPAFTYLGAGGLPIAVPAQGDQTIRLHGCQVAPPKPAVVTENRTIDGTVSCGTHTVAVLNQVRSHDWTYNATTNTWVAAAWSAWTTASTGSRPATSAECPIIVPDPQKPAVTTAVTVTEGTPDCATQTMPTTTVTTTHDWTLNAVTRIWEPADTATTTTGSRAATVVECPVAHADLVTSDDRTVPGTPDCLAGSGSDIVQTRSGVRSWDAVLNQYGTVVWGQWVTSSIVPRLATTDECPVVVPSLGPIPAPEVATVVSAGQPDCDTHTVTTATTTTTTTYVLDGPTPSAWVKGDPTQVTTAAIRETTDQECGSGNTPTDVPAPAPVAVPAVLPLAPTVPPVVSTPTGLFPSVGVSAAFLEAPAVAQAAAAQPQAPALAATGTSGALPVGTMGAVFLLLGGSLFLLRRRLR